MQRALAALAVIALYLAPVSPAGAQDVSEQLAAAQERANAAASRLAVAETALARAEAEVGDLRSRAKQAEDRLARLRVQVRELAVRQYVSSGSGSSWLSHHDLSEAARGQAMLRYVTLGATDAIDAYRAARADLEAGREALERTLAERTRAVARLRDERAKVAAELDRLARAQRELEARARVEAAARAKRQASSRARTAVASTPAVAGEWVCPVAGPHAFSNDWGQPRSGGRRHQGTDIFAAHGTPVVASVSGVVRHHNSDLGGLSYFLRGDDGNTYFGTHLSRFGQQGRVSAGTVVGYVGTSGNARGTSPHLHFEIHPGGGAAVNPYPTLSKYC